MEGGGASSAWNGEGVVAAPPASSSRPKVAIVGAGSVGLYVGARLASAGRVDVCFLMRSDFAAAREKGVNVESATAGNMRIATPWCVRSAYELGACDWVVCALKSTAICQAALRELVAPCFEQGRTKIQILMNGLGIEEQFAEVFGAHNIYGGLVMGGLTRIAPAHVRHEGIPVEIRGGHFLDDPACLREAARLWEGVNGVVFSPQPCLLRAQWQKLCWNFTFNGLTVLAGGCGVDKIVVPGAMLASAERLMKELVALANADLHAHGKIAAATMNPDDIAEQMLAVTRSMKAYKPSTTVDFIKKNRMEVDSIFLEPLRRATKLNVDAPVLTVVAGLLGTIQPST